MQSLDLLAQIILNIIKQPYVTIFVTIGYLTYSKSIFSKALYLLAFTMICNAFLKSLWQVPLSPELAGDNQAWAFPSGHMQIACAFWGWLAYEFKSNKLRYIIGVMLICFGGALIHQNYHDYQDVLAALLFALLEIICLKMIIAKIKLQEHPLIGIIFSGLGWTLMIMMPKSYPHLWLAQGVLLGFSIGYYLNMKRLAQNNNFKIHKIVIALIGMMLIYKIVSVTSMQAKYQAFIGYFLISLWISYVTDFIVAKFFNKTVA